jgi:hypothetical protein
MIIGSVGVGVVLFGSAGRGDLKGLSLAKELGKQEKRGEGRDGNRDRTSAKHKGVTKKM